MRIYSLSLVLSSFHLINATFINIEISFFHIHTNLELSFSFRRYVCWNIRYSSLYFVKVLTIVVFFKSSTLTSIGFCIINLYIYANIYKFRRI